MIIGKEIKVYDMTIAVIYKDDQGGFSYYYIIEEECDKDSITTPNN